MLDDVQVKGAECVVMAGDPSQLPPTVLSPPTSEAALDLQYTLYARLADAGGARGVLKVARKQWQSICLSTTISYSVELTPETHRCC